MQYQGGKSRIAKRISTETKIINLKWLKNYLYIIHKNLVLFIERGV